MPGKAENRIAIPFFDWTRWIWEGYNLTLRKDQDPILNPASAVAISLDSSVELRGSEGTGLAVWIQGKGTRGNGAWYYLKPRTSSGIHWSSMNDERRYDEEEVAEILERATADDRLSAPGAETTRAGLTLIQLQEIGSEVGIPAARIAEAARAIASRDLAGAPTTFLGTPRSVARIVPIPRALDDDEWTRLVVDLRETFCAVGKVKMEGPLRTWSNGNLQIHVEPDGDRYRVRMLTLKGDTVPRAAVGAFFTVVGVLLLLMGTLGAADASNLLMGAVFGLAGVVQLGYTRSMLPRWATERASQMEGLAERIPRLLEE